MTKKQLIKQKQFEMVRRIDQNLRTAAWFAAVRADVTVELTMCGRGQMQSHVGWWAFFEKPSGLQHGAVLEFVMVGGGRVAVGLVLEVRTVPAAEQQPIVDRELNGRCACIVEYVMLEMKP
jgi:hypothetical protein